MLITASLYSVAQQSQQSKRCFAHQSEAHLDAAFNEEQPPAKFISRPQRNISGKVIDDARDNGGCEGGILAGAQGDEQLRCVKDDCVDSGPLQATVQTLMAIHQGGTCSENWQCAACRSYLGHKLMKAV